MHSVLTTDSAWSNFLPNETLASSVAFRPLLWQPLGAYISSGDSGKATMFEYLHLRDYYSCTTHCVAAKPFVCIHILPADSANYTYDGHQSTLQPVARLQSVTSNWPRNQPHSETYISACHACRNIPLQLLSHSLVPMHFITPSDASLSATSVPLPTAVLLIPPPHNTFVFLTITTKSPPSLKPSHLSHPFSGSPRVAAGILPGRPEFQYRRVVEGETCV
ncbi:hypothetical protein EDB19DRAFT_1733891, partial [Suillus lakei]